MNAMSTQIKKLNWRKLRNDSLVKERWGDTKVVFDYNNLVSTISVYQISPKDNEVWFSVKSAYAFDGESYKGTSFIRIPLSDDHYNEDIFQKKLARAITSNISEIEKQLVVAHVDAYFDFCDARDEEISKFLNAINEKYKDLDEMALDAIVRKAKEDLGYVYNVSSFIFRLREFILPTHYVTLANFFQDEELYNQYSQNLSIELKDKYQEVYEKSIRQMNEDLDGTYEDWELERWKF